VNLMFEATYENGVFRPVAQVPGLTEGQRVTITVEDAAEIQKREAELHRQMEEEGLIVHFPEPEEPPPANFKPIEVIGKPISETIIEERR
jgi:predicted DNA-binding antitoxin AbrB/MazE fold protein